MSTIQFSSTRFKNILLRELKIIKKPFLMVALGLISILCIPYFIGVLFGGAAFSIKNYFNFESMISTTFIVGSIWASISFAELNQASGKQFYLSIPASTFEKILSKWLICIFLPVAFVIIYIGIANLITFVTNILIEQNINYLWPSFKNLSEFFPITILVNTLFFTVSIWSPKYSFFKTLFGVFGIFILLALINFLFARVLFYEHFNGMTPNNNISINYNPFEIFNSNLWKYLAGIIVTIFLLVVSYFKLKEKEL